MCCKCSSCLRTSVFALSALSGSVRVEQCDVISATLVFIGGPLKLCTASCFVRWASATRCGCYLMNAISIFFRQGAKVLTVTPLSG